MSEHLDACTARNLATGLTALEERARAKRAASIVTEPIDGTEGMVICADCKSAGVPDFKGRGGCAHYIPSQQSMHRHCSTYLPRVSR